MAIASCDPRSEQDHRQRGRDQPRPPRSIPLPDGKYLISVIADGFKIDGTHFTVRGDDTTVQVKMNPVPLPTVTVRVNVFNDNVSTNG